MGLGLLAGGESAKGVWEWESTSRQRVRRWGWGERALESEGKRFWGEGSERKGSEPCSSLSAS